MSRLRDISGSKGMGLMHFQALRLDFLARRREWEADQERVAEEMGVGMGEEEEEGTWRRETQTQDMDGNIFLMSLRLEND